MAERLFHRCAIVTGASAGLGAEFVRQLAPSCATLVLVARRRDRLDEQARELRREYPGLSVGVIAADLTVPEERAAVVERLRREGVRPDLLVNNAGMGDYGEFVSSDWPKVEAMLRLNIGALTHLTHALVPDMAKAGGGAVLNVSSLACLLPIPDFAVYAATKAYVTSFSEALRIELRGHGIRVMALCPGPVHTEFGEVAKRGESHQDFGAKEWFYVDPATVVGEALDGLARDRARVYPGLKIAIAAGVISVLPIALIRMAMRSRPRR